MAILKNMIKPEQKAGWNDGDNSYKPGGIYYKPQVSGTKSLPKPTPTPTIGDSINSWKQGNMSNSNILKQIAANKLKKQTSPIKKQISPKLTPTAWLAKPGLVVKPLKTKFIK
jgi:hypothetical protein